MRAGMPLQPAVALGFMVTGRWKLRSEVTAQWAGPTLSRNAGEGVEPRETGDGWPWDRILNPPCHADSAGLGPPLATPTIAGRSSRSCST